jgi:hypothetical protein
MRLIVSIVGLLTSLSSAALAQPSQAWSVDASASALAYQDVEPDGAASAALSGLLDHTSGQYFMPEASAGAQLLLSSRSDSDGLGFTSWGQGRALELGDAETNLLPIDLNYQIDWNSRPSLSARRMLWRRPFSAVKAGWRLSAGTYRGFSVMHMGGDTSFLKQGDELSQKQYEFELSFVRYVRERADGQLSFELDVLRADSNAIDLSKGADAVVVEFDFARVRGGKLAGAYWDLALGVGGTGSFSSSVSVNDKVVDEVMVNTENLPLMSTGIGDARIYGTRKRMGASLGAERSVYLTADVELAIETRVSSALSWTGNKSDLSLEAFAAHTELWLDKVISEEALTGGGKAGWRRTLKDDLSLQTSVEVARSYYATLSGEVRPSPGLAVETMATLTKHFSGKRR